MNKLPVNIIDVEVAIVVGIGSAID